MELECLPLAVGHEDEGISLLVRMGSHRILLDCGLDDLSPLLNAANGIQPIDLVLVSHAHPDHTRGLLALHQLFPDLPIYASEVTAQLLFLYEMDGGNDGGEGMGLSEFCQILSPGNSLELKPGLSVQIFPAGHLPGAIVFLLTYTTPQRPYTLLYTGDFFLSNSRLVEGLPLGELRGLKPDVLIIEGSYGTARHTHRRQLENQLAEKIYHALLKKQSILLPAPALGMGQELLMLLRIHHYFTGKDIDIWVDKSLAQCCDIYLKLLSKFPTSVQNFAQHQSLFWDDRVRPRVRRFSPQFRTEIHEKPCIFIADYYANWLEYISEGDDRWLILIPQKPGQKMPAKLRTIKNLETYLLVEHCDGTGTTQFIHNIRPQHIIFIHGSLSYLADLTNLEELRNRYQLHTPLAGSLVELPIGDTFLQPVVPETQYQGEVAEFSTEIAISLPNTITTDSRWTTFADTGLVEARWQGEELVLRGLSQREILVQASDRPLASNLECCGNCQYYRGQRCWNQRSPLLGFKVTVDGFCPAFEMLISNAD